MKLKAVVTSLDGLPDWAKELYTQVDGKYVLQLDGELPGFVPKSKLDEFRTNNVALLKQMEDLEKAGLKLSPEQKADYDRMMEEHRKIKDKELIDAGKIDELVQQRTESMRRDYEAKYGALDAKYSEVTKNYATVESRLASTLIGAEISKHISSVGSLRKGAMDDVLNRARATFTYKDGNIVALDSEGAPVYGKDGKTPMAVSEWCQGLAESAPYFFEGSSGGGGSGSGAGGGGNNRAISRGDNKAFMSNLEGIAKGEVNVVG